MKKNIKKITKALVVAQVLSLASPLATTGVIAYNNVNQVYAQENENPNVSIGKSLFADNDEKKEKEESNVKVLEPIYSSGKEGEAEVIKVPKKEKKDNEKENQEAIIVVKPALREETKENENTSKEKEIKIENKKDQTRRNISENTSEDKTEKETKTSIVSSIKEIKEPKVTEEKISPMVLVNNTNAISSVYDSIIGSGYGVFNPISLNYGFYKTTDIPYVNWALMIANDNKHGYSQIIRESGIDFDCSSLVWSALTEEGFKLGDRAFSTSDMDFFLRATGFERFYFNRDELEVGDILLRSGHTEIYIGDGKSVGAHIAETGGIHGLPGDQTGHEISVVPCEQYAWAYRAPRAYVDEINKYIDDFKNGGIVKSIEEKQSRIDEASKNLKDVENSYNKVDKKDKTAITNIESQRKKAELEIEKLENEKAEIEKRVNKIKERYAKDIAVLNNMINTLKEESVKDDDKNLKSLQDKAKEKTDTMTNIENKLKDFDQQIKKLKEENNKDKQVISLK